MVNGVDSFYCNGKNYTAEHDQLVLINPGEVHTGNTVSDTPLQYYSLYPGRQALEQIASSLNISLSNDLYFQRPVIDKSLLTEKFKKFFDSLNGANNLLQQQELLVDCMHELLKPGNDHQQQHQLKKDNRVQLLIDFMNEHYKEDISLQQLAGKVSLNPFHLVRLFKRSVGVSPYDYLLIVKAERAKQMLRKGFKVQDAAVASGFYDASHFNRVFYKIAGISPKSFRSSKSQYRTSFTG